MFRILAALTGFALTCQSADHHQTENVIFVMTDGLRWQELFHGADAALINEDQGGVKDVSRLRIKYWRESERERRAALMPFLWTNVVNQGQIYGNLDLHSDMYLTNGLNFSYPGYSEALTGTADSRVNSNDKVSNPNVSVLEWLNKKPEYHGLIAAFTAWDVFPSILNVKRSGLLVNAGWDPFLLLPGNHRISTLNLLKRDGPRYWDEEPFDAIPFYTALEYLKHKRPRVLFVSLGETDDWAHEKRYDLYLHAAHRADQYLQILWNTAQSLPQYRNKTTLLFATDHGRGEGSQWTTHGEKVTEAKHVWLMVVGPDTPAKGEQRNTAVTQNQLAATIAALLGQNFHSTFPLSGEPIRAVVAR
ncbi:MAG: sulfatase-like hydrolase/transferase [Acidobacteriaceae bacterium]|nr:sulfatase-like hydrolase/transferase [Acidobacteriaceae bacterium]